MNKEILEDLKNEFNWQLIIDFANSLTDLNYGQWRFAKGLVIEFTLEDHGEKTFMRVGLAHKDFDWTKHSITVEVKSQMSDAMYTPKRGDLRKKYSGRLNNSHGDNKTTLDPADVADLILVIRNDGSFVIEKEVIMAHLKYGKGHWDFVVPGDKIIEISGPIKTQVVYPTTLRHDLETVMKSAIPKKQAVAP